MKLLFPKELTATAIIELETQMIEAVKNHYVPFFETHLHPEYHFLSPSGFVMSRKTEIERHVKEAMTVEYLQSRISNICFVNQSAIVNLKYESKGLIYGQPFDGVFDYIRIWKLTDGELKIIGGSCSRIAS